MSKPRTVLYADLFDPPTFFHRKVVEAIQSDGFEKVVLYPAGLLGGSPSEQNASPMHCAAMMSLCFVDYHNLSIDDSDTPLRFDEAHHPVGLHSPSSGELWLVISYRILVSRNERSAWERAWQVSFSSIRDAVRFVVIAEEGDVVDAAILPKIHRLIRVAAKLDSSKIRSNILQSRSIEALVPLPVSAYIRRHRLFSPGALQRQATFQSDEPKLLIVHDERNPEAVAVEEKYARFRSESPNLILVLGGDGTMLRAIREHWRSRLPFVGLNTGHLGFLMNEALPDDLTGIQLVTYNQPLLRVDSKKPNGEHTWGLAYTDVWMERAEGQAAWMRVEVDGETRVSKVVGDGMLVATAAGSSAYARAMGAVPVPIDTPTLTLAGSNIFQPRFWKPMILSHDSRITISSLDRSDKRPVRGFIDGAPLGIIQELTVRRSLTAGVELAFTKDFDPSARLLRSLFPPDE